MSEVLTDFIAPYRQEADTKEAYRKLLTLAIMAWNTALLEESEQQEIVDKMVAEGLGEANEELKQGLKDIVHQLIARKKQYFPENKRLIIDFDLKDTGTDYHLSVASSLSETS